MSHAVLTGIKKICTTKILGGELHFSDGAILPIELPKVGCDFCDGVPSKYKDLCIVKMFHQTAADKTYEIDVPVNFCPNCAKDLKRK